MSRGKTSLLMTATKHALEVIEESSIKYFSFNGHSLSISSSENFKPLRYKSKILFFLENFLLLYIFYL